MSACPNCHEAGAYIGIIHVKCVNSNCIYYDDALYEEMKSKTLAECLDTALENYLNELPPYSPFYGKNYKP